MKLWPLAILCSAIGVASPTFANPAAPVVLPTGGQVVSGAATITSRTGSSLTITQSSNSAIVNWNTFNIGSSGSVTFAQPSTSISVLNRTPNGAPAIYGTLTSNGRVFLLNPGGIMIAPVSITIAPGSRINSAAFVTLRPSALSAMPNPPLMATATIPPPRPALSVAAPANPVRMIDGAVTLRTPLVDASPILFR